MKLLVVAVYSYVLISEQGVVYTLRRVVKSSWNVTAHGEAREGKWRGNWRMEWVASTLHTTSEHGLSSITTADVHTSAELTPSPIWMDSSVLPEDEIWFLRVCHHISNAVYQWSINFRIICSFVSFPKRPGLSSLPFSMNRVLFGCTVSWMGSLDWE